MFRKKKNKKKPPVRAASVGMHRQAMRYEPQEIIEDYLLAIQKLDVQLTYLAFQAGKNAKRFPDLYTK